MGDFETICFFKWLQFFFFLSNKDELFKVFKDCQLYPKQVDMKFSLVTKNTKNYDMYGKYT